MCWHGKHDILLVIESASASAVGFADGVSAEDTLALSLFPGEDEGESVKSTSSHQSSSVHCFLIPHASNHFLFPRGTKKWHSGCNLWISMMVGCERWS